ncbi:MAG TPA: glycosyltransferase family 4 protein [Alphaproteobacteria bacterium]|nr:glycosyltransferase family 4 protein [Alphaproteobacteria bacterium]
MDAPGQHPNTAAPAAPTLAGQGKPPAILQVLPALHAGGVERGTVDMARAIVAAGWRAVVASSGGYMTREIERAGATHITLPLASKNPVRMWRNVAALERVIDEHGIDIVHARSRAPAWSARAAAQRSGVHFMTTFHGLYGAGSGLKRFYNSVMAKGELVIAISQFVAEHLQTVYGVPPERIRVIHRGVDLSQFDADRVSEPRLVQLAQKWRLPDDRSIILLPGRLSRWKGQDLAIEALALLRRNDVLCVMVGAALGSPRWRREVESLVHRLGVEGVVMMVDECRDMPSAYRLADIVVVPSRKPEAFGRTVTEAQAMGRIVVAADHGGARETVSDGHTGWLFRPNDAGALAEAMARALALDAPTRLAIGANAVEAVRARFSNAVMCERTLGVYRELLATARATV